MKNTYTEMIIHDKNSDEYFWTDGKDRLVITEEQAEEIIGDWELQGHFANYESRLGDNITQEWY